MPNLDRLRQVGPIERSLFLRSIDAEVDTAGLAALVEHGRERSYQQGDTIFAPGARVHSFHIVVEGTVRVHGAEFTEETIVESREPIGFLAMMGQWEDGMSAVAEDNTLTLEFEEELFYDILEDNFSLLNNLMQRLGKRTLDVRKQVPNGAYLSSPDTLTKARGEHYDLVERIQFIRRPGSPFQFASLEAIARLAQATPEVHYPAGSTIWQLGDRSDYALILVDGVVVCTTQWGASRFRAGPGYPLGNLERFAGEPRWYSAVSETPLVAFRTETETFLDILEDHSDLARTMLQSMAARAVAINQETAAANATQPEPEPAPTAEVRQETVIPQSFERAPFGVGMFEDRESA